MSQRALSIRGLRIRYGQGPGAADAVCGIDLDIARGEVVALVGESGSGKTSICRAAIGVSGARATVSADRLEVGGRSLLGARPATWHAVRRSLVAFVPQQPMNALVPTVAVGRQLDWHLGAGALARYEADLASLGLDAVLARPTDLPAGFSGGQLQRLVIAIATLGGEPSLIIADEPTSTLDATVSVAVLDALLARQRRLGAGMAFVSHDLATVAGLADRVVVVDRGEAVESGPVAEVLGRPSHRRTQELLDALAATRRQRSDGHGPKPAGPPRLRVDHAYCYFGGAGRPGSASPPTASVVRAVDDVSLELRAGTVTALVGESGSGKTTLARLIAGAQAATAGEVLLDGVALGNDRTLAQRRAIQLVSQDHRGAFNRRRTLRHALDQVQRVHGIGTHRQDRHARAVATIERVGLRAEHLARRPRELSGGEAARMALARALLLSPEVLVLDEPTAGLDAAVRAAVLDLLADLRAADALAMLVITHEIDVARALASEVAVMHHGQLVEVGPADQVLATPADPYTQALLASVPAAPQDRAWI